jgi:putative ABC transport system permease protein
MGIRVSQGRDFNEADTPNTKRVAIINQYMARAFWPHEPNVIGKRIIIMDWPAQLYEIIGVAEDVRAWPREKFSSQVYASYTQPAQPFYTDLDNPSPLDFWFAVRTRVNPAALGGAVRHAMREVDKGAAVEQIRPMDEVVSAALGPWRSTMLLLGFLAGLALLLSAIGIYGVISYAVAQRTHEIGVRMALGARRIDVLRLVVGNAVLLAIVGLGIGLPISFAMARLLASTLFGVVRMDVVVFVIFTAVLALTAALAGYLPARWATRVDPTVALRYE